jgi:hypothetical protein
VWNSFTDQKGSRSESPTICTISCAGLPTSTAKHATSLIYVSAQLWLVHTLATTIIAAKSATTAAATATTTTTITSTAEAQRAASRQELDKAARKHELSSLARGTQQERTSSGRTTKIELNSGQK